MVEIYGPKIVTNGLILALDAADVDYHQVHIYKITKLEERITELEEIIKKIQ